ncbi:conserved hypothetical protein [mine drainage metagenome]|uniref:Uncharacterized protein n=1 Tax=mine drainage metagenome TaxID=410659 RepID=A0A3P3ZMN6_9ZZZZ
MRHAIPVYDKKEVAMQRISDGVTRGYPLYCDGSISAEKLPRLVDKFRINYQVDADKNSRAYRQRKGLGNAKLILWKKFDDLVLWWLFVSENGEHAARDLETLKNARKDRVRCDDFELVLLTKKDAPKPRMTWRYTSTKYNEHREAIIASVRSRSPASMSRTIALAFFGQGCGFYGARSQIGKLASLYRAEVVRASLKTAPNLPERLRYVRRLRG